MEVKLNYQRAAPKLEIEVNPSLRGHLLPVRDMVCSDQLQEQFEAFVEARCVSHRELFGGNIAVLDRQHPRDLFDVKRLLDEESLIDEVRLSSFSIVTERLFLGEPKSGSRRAPANS